MKLFVAMYDSDASFDLRFAGCPLRSLLIVSKAGLVFVIHVVLHWSILLIYDDLFAVAKSNVEHRMSPVIG